MAVVTRTINPVNIVAGAKRTSASQNIPQRVRGIKLTLTTESPNSWTDVAGLGRIVRWGAEYDVGAGFVEWFSTNNIPFGALGKGGNMPTQLLDNAQAIKDALGSNARLFIETEGVTVRLGCIIEASNNPGELSG